MKIENKIEVFDIPERVTCKICGAERRCLNNAHLSSHGLTDKLYKKMFPGAHTVCSETLLKQSKNSKSWLKQHPEHLLKIPKSKIQIYLQEEKTKEKRINHDKAVRMLPHSQKKYSKHFKELWDDPEYRKKMSEIVSKNLSIEKLWCDPEYRKKMSEVSSRPKTKKQKEKLSKSKKEYWKKIKGTEEETVLCKHLSNAQRKRFEDPDELERFRKIVKSANKIKSEKRKALKRKLMPKIKELRNKGFIYREISKKIGVSEATISNWLRGEGR